MYYIKNNHNGVFWDCSWKDKLRVILVSSRNTQKYILHESVQVIANQIPRLLSVPSSKTPMFIQLGNKISVTTDNLHMNL